MTTKPGKLYFTFFIEPRVPFELPAMKNAVKRAYFLANGTSFDVVVKDGRVVHAPRPILDPMGTVVVVEIRGRDGGALRLGLRSGEPSQGTRTTTATGP